MVPLLDGGGGSFLGEELRLVLVSPCARRSRRIAEVEMNAAIVLKATKAAGVFRKIKVS